MKKIGMIVLFSLFLLAMPVPAWGASTELAPYLEDLDMEQIDAAAENAVEDVTFSEPVSYTHLYHRTADRSELLRKQRSAHVWYRNKLRNSLLCSGRR